MTRFVSPDLTALAPPASVEVLDFETILSQRIADLTTRAQAAGLPDVADVLQLESEPLAIVEQTNSYFEMNMRQRVNDAIRACLISQAEGPDLDQLAATFYGVSRLLITAGNPNASPPTADVYEDDDTFRDRALLSLEAQSSAGPTGAYIYFALQADANVLDAACYGEEDGATYVNGASVIAPEVLVVVLSRVGNGVPDSTLLTTVQTALNAKEIRPIGDKVTVEPATVVEYSVVGTIKYAAGADSGVVATQAQTNLQTYTSARQRIGRVIQIQGLAAQLQVSNADEIELQVFDQYGSPITADIDPGSKGACYCTSIQVNTQVSTDGWR